MRKPALTRPAGLHSYRADIDGLRAVAVMAVVFYHAGVWPFTGGFVGVDVFFVISGYLITSLIIEEVDAGRFSLLNFYLRRARRILPALFTVIATTLVIGFLVLMPEELDALSESALWATFFNSNIYFMTTTGYFDAPAETKPLLHIWSLSIEEQFYFFWPLIVVVFFYFNRRLGLAIIVLALCSFVAGAFVLAHWQKVAFYFAPLRAWELLIGCFLATRPHFPRSSRLGPEAMAVCGAILVLVGMFAYSTETLFPGASALVPCIGTALLIYAGSQQSTVIGMVLSARPIVGVGLISYSLYLWHWPVFVFYRAYIARDLASAETAALIALSFALALITWRFVEQPFRNRASWFFQTRQLVGACVAGVVFITGFGAAGVIYDGFPARLPDNIEMLARGVTDQDFENRAECYNLSAPEVDADDLCSVGPTSDQIRFLVWGDSHALALMPAFQKLAEDHRLGGYYAPRSSCEPLLGDIEDSSEGCKKFKDAVVAFIERHRVPVVILVAEWPKSPEGLSDLRRGLETTLARLSRSVDEIWIVEDVPAVPVPSPPAALAQLAIRNQSFHDIEVATKHSSLSNLPAVAVFDEIDNKYRIHRIDLLSALCDQEICQVEHEGRSLYRDSDHLSKFGALHVAPDIEPLFRTMKKPVAFQKVSDPVSD